MYRLIESGIVNFLIKKFEIITEDKETFKFSQKPLGLDDLATWFYIWLICMHFCWLCFFGELLWHKVKEDYNFIVQSLRKRNYRTTDPP